MTAPSKGTVYVAGPMRGYEDFNFGAFDAAAHRLRMDGWTVLSPAEHDRDGGFDETLNSLDGFDLAAAFRWDVEAILQADAIYLLNGWQESVGATLERSIAETIGIAVLYESPPEAPESVLEEAQRIVLGPRQADYGHPSDDFARTGRMWGAIIGIPDVAPATVGLCMAAVKISREVNAPKRDNLVDLAGYTATVDLIRQRDAA